MNPTNAMPERKRPFSLALFALFPNCRPCDVTSENCFFQMSRFPRAHACIANERHVTELGK